jgi:hypothetical protein
MYPQIMLGKQAFLLPKFDKSSLIAQEVELQSYYAYYACLSIYKHIEPSLIKTLISMQIYPLFQIRQKQNSAQKQRLCSPS